MNCEICAIARSHGEVVAAVQGWRGGTRPYHAHTCVAARLFSSCCSRFFPWCLLRDPNWGKGGEISRRTECHQTLPTPLSQPVCSTFGLNMYNTAQKQVPIAFPQTPPLMHQSIKGNASQLHLLRNSLRRPISPNQAAGSNCNYIRDSHSRSLSI